MGGNFEKIFFRKHKIKSVREHESENRKAKNGRKQKVSNFRLWYILYLNWSATAHVERECFRTLSVPPILGLPTLYCGIPVCISGTSSLILVYTCAAARRGTIVGIGVDRAVRKIDTYGL